MRTLPILVFLLAACLLPVLAESPGEAVDDFLDNIKNIELFRLRTSPAACPVPIVGQKCPEGNPLFFFKCCDKFPDVFFFDLFILRDLNASCCFRLQDWVMVLMVLLAVCIVLSIVVNLIRCLCCV